MSYQSVPKVPLMTLTMRVSKSGKEYLSGFLGQSSVVGFKGEPNEYGETWQLYLQERPKKGDQPAQQRTAPQKQDRPEREYHKPLGARPAREKAESTPAFVDDRLPWEE